MGYNGTVNGCDNCTGVKRDAEGFAWFPGEAEHNYQPNDKSLSEFTVSRVVAGVI